MEEIFNSGDIINMPKEMEDIYPPFSKIKLIKQVDSENWLCSIVSKNNVEFVKEILPKSLFNV